MPWKDPEQRRAAQAAYRRTPQGQAAHQRARARWLEKRSRRQGPLTINPAPLAQVLKEWKQ